MLPIEDYREAYELITQLAPDFIHAALVAKIAPNTEEKRDYESKAAYIYALNEAIKTMNSLRFSTNPLPSKRDNTPINHNRNNY